MFTNIHVSRRQIDKQTTEGQGERERDPQTQEEGGKRRNTNYLSEKSRTWTIFRTPSPVMLTHPLATVLDAAYKILKCFL